MEGIKWRGCAKGFVGQMAVHGHVNQKDECWEVDQETHFVRAKEARAALSHVCAEAVKRHREARNVKSIPDENVYTVQPNNCRPLTQDRDVEIIAHPNVQPANVFV